MCAPDLFWVGVFILDSSSVSIKAISNMRVYDFDNILNFRDFGNYTTQDGRQVAAARLFRSANFHKASRADLVRLRDLDIRLLVDLRHLPEREKQPNQWPDTLPTRMVLFEDVGGIRAADMAPHEAFVKQDLRDPEDARQYMLRSYRTRPDDPGFRKIFADTLTHMSDTGDSLVIHCAAGKDRTGTLAAVILSVLGVDEDTIMHDYMATMTAVDIESFLEPAAKMMTTRYGRPYSPEALRPMFGVEPDYLKQSLEAIGDMNAYVRDVLGISDMDIAKIKAAYLTA